MGYDIRMHQISSPPSFHTSMNKLIDSPQVYTVCKCQISILLKDGRKHDIESESTVTKLAFVICCASSFGFQYVLAGMLSCRCIRNNWGDSERRVQATDQRCSLRLTHAVLSNKTNQGTAKLRCKAVKTELHPTEHNRLPR